MPSRSRVLRQQQEHQASWDRLRTEPWSPSDITRAFGSGQPRIQLLRVPAFTPPAFWEVCQRDSDWLLYSSTVVDPHWPAVTVQGYELVDFDWSKLQSYFERLTSLKLPVSPDLSRTVGLDGTVTQLVLVGDLWSEVRFQWWSKHPPDWTPLVRIADEMFAAFGGQPET